MFSNFKIRLVFLLVIFFCSSFIYSQSYPRIQMPYGLNNVWILKISQHEIIRWEYIDTNYVIDSMKYYVLTTHTIYPHSKKKLENSSLPFYLSRIREDGYHVERLDTTYPQPFHEWIHWKENPQIGDRWENEPIPGSTAIWQYQIMDKAYLPIFNSWDTIYALKVHNFPAPYELIANYSQRFGIVSTSAEFETAFLKGCVIDGVVYGDTTFFATDIEDEDDLPNEYWLKQNYPNPFNPETVIGYQVPGISRRLSVDGHQSQEFVSIIVYDLMGRQVAVLVNEEQQPGKYSVTFNASSLSSGVYIVTMKAGTFTQSRKISLLK